jgi:hypothetical protein
MIGSAGLELQAGLILKADKQTRESGFYLTF